MAGRRYLPKDSPRATLVAIFPPSYDRMSRAIVPKRDASTRSRAAKSRNRSVARSMPAPLLRVAERKDVVTRAYIAEHKHGHVSRTRKWGDLFNRWRDPLIPVGLRDPHDRPREAIFHRRLGGERSVTVQPLQPRVLNVMHRARRETTWSINTFAMSLSARRTYNCDRERRRGEIRSDGSISQ